MAYGTATEVNDTGSVLLNFVRIFARLTWWSVLPSGRRALFYDFWGGSRSAPDRFRRRLAADLTSVLRLLADGSLTAHVAARLPLAEAPAAMTLAESRIVYGKVVLTS